MANTKTISIRVSNTYRGSLVKGVFEHETDRNGRWIPSDNIRITCSDTDITLPAVLEVDAISDLASQKPDLVFVPDTEYQKFKVIALEPNTELDLPASKAYFYRPVKPDCTMEVANASSPK